MNRNRTKNPRRINNAKRKPNGGECGGEKGGFYPDREMVGQLWVSADESHN